MRIKIVDVWSDFFINMPPLIVELINELNLELVDDDPDLLIFSAFGKEHLKKEYDSCVKVLYSLEPFNYEENILPWWERILKRLRGRVSLYDVCNRYIKGLNESHLAITHLYLDSPYHYRLPIPVSQYGFDTIKQVTDLEQLQVYAQEKTRFCWFMASHGDQRNKYIRQRDRLFHELCKYKKVDSYGGHLNNMGFRPPYCATPHHEMELTKNYKFCIAMENTSEAGFYTRRVLTPMLVNTIPIVQGNPVMQREFNRTSFINVPDYEDHIEAVVERVIELDQNQELYANMLQQPFFTNNELPNAYQRAPFYEWLQKRLSL